MSFVDRQEAIKADRARKQRLGLIPPPQVIAFPPKAVTTTKESTGRVIVPIKVSRRAERHALVSSLQTQIIELKSKIRDMNEVATLTAGDRGVIADLRRKAIDLQSQVAELTRANAVLRGATSTGRLPLEPIVDAVSKYYKVEKRHMFSKRRLAGLVMPRQIAMFLAKTLTDSTFPEIGRMISRDHTTVIHGVKKIERLMERDPKLVAQIAAISETLGYGHV